LSDGDPPPCASARCPVSRHPSRLHAPGWPCHDPHAEPPRARAFRDADAQAQPDHDRALHRHLAAAASCALKELEAQTGFSLVTREHQRMVPTAEAKSLLAKAERLLAQADMVHRQIEALQAGSVRAMRVASILSVCGTLLPTVISGFRRVQPGVDVQVEGPFWAAPAIDAAERRNARSAWNRQENQKS
jgi:hypothetical protein